MPGVISFGRDFVPEMSLKKHEFEDVLADYEKKFGSQHPLPITATNSTQGKPSKAIVNPSIHLHDLYAFEGDPQPDCLFSFVYTMMGGGGVYLWWGMQRLGVHMNLNLISIVFSG